MLALRVPVALAPATLAFRLVHSGGGESAHAGDAFAVPFGMAAGDPSVLGVRPAFASSSKRCMPCQCPPCQTTSHGNHVCEVSRVEGKKEGGRDSGEDVAWDGCRRDGGCFGG